MTRLHALALALALPVGDAPPAAVVVVVDRDNVEVRASCTVRVADRPIPDHDRIARAPPAERDAETAFAAAGTPPPESDDLRSFVVRPSRRPGPAAAGAV